MSHYTVLPINSDTADYLSWSKLWQGYLTFYHTTLPESQYKNTFDRLIDPNGDLFGHLLVSSIDGRSVGLAHYLYHANAWTPARHCYLNDLYVDPSERGKGGGALLIQAVQKEAQLRGCVRLYWTTAPDNVTARALYDKVGTTNRVVYKIDLDQADQPEGLESSTPT
jgi:GNAT superfamily N-acetyltransferase